jgi:hypothetical protein
MLTEITLQLYGYNINLKIAGKFYDVWSILTVTETAKIMSSATMSSPLTGRTWTPSVVIRCCGLLL